MLSQKFSALFETQLESAISSAQLPLVLREAITYALFPAGKRVRPALCLSLCSDLSGNAMAVLPAAVALEIIHSASLIHDDLPELDNDEMRRGRPSCHVKFGHGTALLLGDLMVPLAILSACRSDLVDSKKVVVISAIASAYQQLCLGQYLDIQEAAERKEVLQIHELKTGALFASAAHIGAVGANASPEICDLAKEFGLTFGRAFQVLDDYIDLFGTDSERGRVGSSDRKNAKETSVCASDTGRREGRLLFMRTISEAEELLGRIKDVLALTQESSRNSELPLTHELLRRLSSRLKDE